MPTLVALLVAAAENEDVKPLAAKSLLVTLALIVVICAAILLAGFGYFGPSDGTD
jgi:hypothetical protein